MIKLLNLKVFTLNKNKNKTKVTIRSVKKANMDLVQIIVTIELIDDISLKLHTYIHIK